MNLSESELKNQLIEPTGKDRERAPGFFQWLNFSSQSLETGALIIGGSTLIGTLLGLLKNTLLAARFGATRDLDIYFAGFRIPDFLYSILVFSALSSSFMPVFARAIKKGKQEVWEMVSAIFGVFSLFFGFFALLVFIFSEQAAGLVAPGFSSLDLERLSVLLKILMLQPILLAGSNLFSITLQGFKKFFVSSLAPVFYNLGIILGIVWLSNFWGINGVGWGVVLGALLHLLIQLPSLKSLGFVLSFSKRALVHLKEMFYLMVPRTFTILANNLVLFWITSVSSLLAGGALGIYNLADSLQSFPLTILVLSLTAAAFPYLSEKWANYQESQDPRFKQEFVDIFDSVLQKISLIIIPVSLLLAVFSQELVRLIFGYGSFTPQDQLLTSLTLVVFAIFLPAQALTTFLIRAFFSTGNTKDPFVSMFASAFLIKIPLVWIFSKPLGVVGLSLGFSLGFLFDCLYLFLVFKKKTKISRLNLFSQGIKTGWYWGAVLALPGLIGFFGFSFLPILARQSFIFQALIKLGLTLISLLIGFKLKLVSFSDFSLFFPNQRSNYEPRTD
ncbi:MAG: murein biosynthesis integral membrane protein MurJ [Patescibacteria group bacterium]